MRPRPGLLAALAVAASVGFAPQAAQDDQILERADRILEECKAAYEAARQKSSPEAFINAGFRLEEARIKYLVLQEIGSPEKQKVAADRLRSVNQLGKLINDGKLAISGKAADPAAPPPAPAKDPPPADPADPAPKAPPAAAPPAAPVDLLKRAPVPEPARQKEAEKLLRELYKDQYARKAPADRQALARALLEQARKSTEDPAALWVVYREAQDVAAGVCDVRTAVTAIDETAKYFDVDVLPMKSGALAAAAKSAKSPEDFTSLVEALDHLIDEFLAVDQYEAAEKSAASALQYARKASAPRMVAHATLRTKEVGEAKARFQAMKAVLQTLARTPDDPSANQEMGQYLCFIKGNWDLGLRFMVKGPDAGLKSLAEKELALPTSPADQASVADGWYDLSEKEKLPSRKTQLLLHAREYYTLALPGLVALQRARVEKRLDQLETAVGSSPIEGGTVNLFKLIDLKKDVLSGAWSQKGNGYTCSPEAGARLQVPWLLPAEYDLTVTLERAADDFLVLGLNGEPSNFMVVIDPNFRAAFEMVDGKDFGAQDESQTFPRPPFPTGKPVVVKASVRRTGVKVFLDGKQILSWDGGMKRLTPNKDWAGPNARCPFLGSQKGQLLFTAVALVPVQDAGKPLR